MGEAQTANLAKDNKLLQKANDKLRLADQLFNRLNFLVEYCKFSEFRQESIDSNINVKRYSTYAFSIIKDYFYNEGSKLESHVCSFESMFIKDAEHIREKSIARLKPYCNLRNYYKEIYLMVATCTS